MKAFIWVSHSRPAWFALCILGFSAANAPAIIEMEWPRVAFRDGVTNTIYQPQLEYWDYDVLKATCAVAVQPERADQPTFGTIRVAAKTRVDRAQRRIDLDSLDIIDGSFPGAGPLSATYVMTLRSLLPEVARTLSLDRVEASLAITGERRRAASQPLKNEPPAVLFSTTPALLVLVDGPPVFRPVGQTGVERLYNTRALILRDASGQFYLHLFDGYMRAANLSGPWKVAGQVPAAVKDAEKAAVKAKQVDLMAGQENPKTKQKPSLKTTPIPKLIVNSGPAELIVIHGEPQWAPLPPTKLLYVTNTTSHVFKNPADQKTYVLISGRWFRSDAFGGPWEYVAGSALPKDFAAMPDDSPKENVKASIPGTAQAEEAVIANGIPNTVKVERRKAAMDPPPQFDGPPLLKPIEETSLQYVVNTQTPVLVVGGKNWYACQNGVWFVATSGAGPWIAATSVPSAVYSIPPSSPLHYIVYCRIFRYDDQYVWVGTTPGYYGALIGADGTIVFGTGYTYPSYAGTTVYVSYPVTYGYGSNPCWTPWVGWSLGFAVAWSMEDDWYWWCAGPPAPYWGPYWYPCYGYYYNAYGGVTAWGPYGWAGTSGYVYHQNGPWTGVTRGAAGYNAWTGNEWATKYGRAYNSTTGMRVAGQRGAVENVYTGNYAYGGRGGFYNEQTGAAGTGKKVTWGNENAGQQGSAGKATVYNPKSGEVSHISGAKTDSGGVVRVNDHVVVGKDGNYYRPNGQGGWEQIPKPLKQGGGVPLTQQALPSRTSVPREDVSVLNQRAQVPTAMPDQQQFADLNREFQARQTGAQREHSFQVSRPAFKGGGGRRR